ncbi:MAG: hypothetical protein JSV25_15385 [Spirochaetota bacterium]|nr:MAG: hypothetical protein JSV25_15385 [Spirochaetota bacterium]
MKKWQIHTIIVLSITIFIWISGYTVYGEEKQVLIANMNSTFKDTVVANLQDEMKGSGIEFSVKSISVLGKVKNEDWDAIVILHAVKMGKIKGQVKKYLDNVNDWSKVIVLTTYGSEDIVSSTYGIDSITAASKTEEIASATEELKNRIRTVLDSGI